MAAGGTGGHIYPAIAVAEELSERIEGASILFVGTPHGLEREILKGHKFELKLLPARPFPKTIVDLRMILAVLSTALASMMALKMLKALKPAAVMSTGGYASIPVIWAAHKLNRPLAILEPNSIPGRANRKFSQWADVICIAFKTAERFLKGNAIHTGLPVRKDFKLLTRVTARSSLGLKEDEFVLLVFGGSRGARKLNIALWEKLEALLKENEKLIIYHICGAHSWEDAQCILSRLPNNLRKRYFVWAYYEDMPKLIYSSDLAITRAGASSIAELLIAGVPSILVPYPYAMDDHQRYNAIEVADAGAAIVVSDDEMCGDMVYQMVSKLMVEKDKLEAMRRAALSIAKPNATETVVEVLLSIARKGGCNLLEA
ncbi:MAG: hypothetical protein RUDDFDWM_001103 [Candidatus Fervidibacterota bacterium]